MMEKWRGNKDVLLQVYLIGMDLLRRKRKVRKKKKTDQISAKLNVTSLTKAQSIAKINNGA